MKIWLKTALAVCFGATALGSALAAEGDAARGRQANQMSGFPLADCRTIESGSMRGNVLHLQADDVAAS